MAPWQVLLLGKISRADPKYRAHHGPRVSVHYSSVAAAPDDGSGSSFGVSGQKEALQQLNRRLESYLQQAQHLEAANQRLERLIQEELQRKSPKELQRVDRHLRTAAQLHEQINQRLSAQAQLKLQLLALELHSFDLNIRWEKELERRRQLEAELSDLRLLGEELHQHKLLELQDLVKAQTQQLAELQSRHQQDVQGLLAQVSGGIAVEMQPVCSPELKQQLHEQRRTSAAKLRENQNWFNTQGFMLPPDPAVGSEVIQAELEELWGAAESLEEELAHLQGQNELLEVSGCEQADAIILQLLDLQKRADSLCSDLDVVLQEAAEQDANHQALLDTKNRLEAEIDTYRRLLDELCCQQIFPAGRSGPAIIRRKVIRDKPVNAEGRNSRMWVVQTIAGGPDRQKPVITPVSAMDRCRHLQMSPTSLIHTSNLEEGPVVTSSKTEMNSTLKVAPKKSTSLSDSDVVLSLPDPEEPMSPVEMEGFMSMVDLVFCPADPEHHISPDSLLSLNDPKMCLSPNELEALSQVEAKRCLSPNHEKDEDASLKLMEANECVRPVEKYILTTREESQSLFSAGHASPDMDRTRNDTVSLKDEDSLCFGSFGVSEGGGDNTESRPTNGGSGNQRGSSPGNISFGGPDCQSIIADREDQLGFGGLYRKRERLAGKTWCVPAPGAPSCSNTGDNMGGLDQSRGSMVANSNSMLSDIGASVDSTTANLTATGDVDTESAVTSQVQGRFRRGSGEWKVYGGSVGRTSLTDDGSEDRTSEVPATSPPGTGRFGSGGRGEWMVYGGSAGRKSSLEGSVILTGAGSEASPLVSEHLATSPLGKRRFSGGGSGEWIVSGRSPGRTFMSLPDARCEESLSVAGEVATSPPERGRFGSGGSGEWKVYGGSLKRTTSLLSSDQLPGEESKECLARVLPLATSPPDTGRVGSGGSGEWPVYGRSPGSTVVGLLDAGGGESPSVVKELATSPPGRGRFGSWGSGEWKVYGGSTERKSSIESTSASTGATVSPPGSHMRSGPRLSTAGSGGGASPISGGVVRHSSSTGSGGRLSSTGSGGPLSGSSGSNRISSSGRFTNTGSGEWKPLYSSSSGRRSSTGSGGWPGQGHRASSPGGQIRTSSSSTGSGSGETTKTGGKVSSSSRSGRTSGTGGRVITCSDRPVRSPGSGTGAKNERISVCKMAALSISAAGRERSQDRRRQAERPQQASATPPLVQQWLTTSMEVTSGDGADD
ncbi:uncharacterized protein ACBR49_012270 isoform 2-T2 [Aulostomus maculatus]